MTPQNPPLRSLLATRQASSSCPADSVYCLQNRRRLVAGRPYVTQQGGILTLESVQGPFRLSFPQWLMHRGQALALFSYRPNNGAPIRFRQRLLGGKVVDLPWRLR